MNRPAGMSKATIKARYRGAILGTAIGDALGAPLESMEKSAITSQLPNLGVSGFSDFLKPDDIKRPPGTRQNVRELGEWTDDTQLMRTILWAIINKNAIDPMEVAEFTKRVFNNEELRGWSGSGKEACARLNKGAPWYRSSDTSIGVGNGVAMKAAPLGLYLSKIDFKTSSWKHAMYSIMGVGQITHHEVGIAAGVLQSVLIAMSLNGLRNRAKILDGLTAVEQEYFNSSRFTDKLKMAVQFDGVSNIADGFGTSPKADRSWVTTAAIFLKTTRKGDAMENMFRLIEQGGDCDTTGAMYGALIGARYGVSVFPMHLRKGVEDTKQLMKWADSMFKKVEFDDDVPPITLYKDTDE